jgi:hypothetical protein
MSSDRIRVIRVRTRETLCRPEIASLVMRGATASGLPSSAATVAELARDIASDHVGCFVGFYGTEPAGLVVGLLPTSAFQLGPVIVIAHSEVASHELTVEAGRRLRAWIEAEGFAHAFALNLQHSDRSFCRGTKHFGASRRVGSVIGFCFGGIA